MLPGQASQTLLIASIMRARHQLFDAPVVLDDPVVLKLVPEAQDPGVLTEFGESRASMASLMRSERSVGAGCGTRRSSVRHVRCWS